VGLAAARLSLLVFPFQRVAGRLGAFVPPDDARARKRGEPSEASREAARQVGWVVRAVAPSMPFKSLCLQQALAAHAMLRRRGIAAPVHFGAGLDQAGRFVAHAWLEVGGVEVTGYPLPPGLREIGCFVPRRD
jgi:hypothetical protein